MFLFWCRWVMRVLVEIFKEPYDNNEFNYIIIYQGFEVRIFMKSIKYPMLHCALISCYVHNIKLCSWTDISSLALFRIIQSVCIYSFKARGRCSYSRPPTLFRAFAFTVSRHVAGVHTVDPPLLLLTRLPCCQPTSHTNRASLVSQNM